jgi:hypothetical protein
MFVPAFLIAALFPLPAVPRSVPVQRSSVKTSQQVETVLSFGFDITDLETNHQFAGQHNTFRVDYEYGAVLKGGSFDPKGHLVNPDAFPYFQVVRDDIASYVKDYKSKKDFYEVLLYNLGKYLMTKYPQLRKLDIRVEVPAHAAVQLDRRARIVLNRGPKNMVASTAQR